MWVPASWSGGCGFQRLVRRCGFQRLVRRCGFQRLVRRCGFQIRVGIFPILIKEIRFWVKNGRDLPGRLSILPLGVYSTSNLSFDLFSLPSRNGSSSKRDSSGGVSFSSKGELDSSPSPGFYQ